MTDHLTENARLRAALEGVVAAYDRSNPMRMADQHRDICDCLRCATDNARAALATPAPDAVQEAARAFDSADWYWRTMDPDDCGDSPNEAISRAMIGNFCVCEIASSFTGPIRYGFTAPVLDADSDDEEFLHFATQQEAIDAARERSAALRAIAGDRT